ncbi:molecular chaperone HscC [Roseburia hominis]|uniref:molecular chaperone HscC n=1 Tax=Roseburia hominis TaxID=301301 RepID=UPI0022E89282|nr:molecular chaperone HscC [Roseburia hominis]
MGKIIGIDLGTTNSAAAVWENGESHLIPNAFGDYLTPSVVSMDRDGTVYVGRIAKERLVTHPADTASVFKRFMGTEKIYSLAGKKYHPEELSALVLKRLKEDAERYLGEEVTEAIISVPAYFNDLARNATKNAGELAGFHVERIINEPSAAALYYQCRSQMEDAVMLVFDFGGGTLDVSLVECFDNIVEILAVSGDNHLGGSDFDQLIADIFWKSCGLLRNRFSAEDAAIVLERAEKCKFELTVQDAAQMCVTLAGREYQMEISRKELIREAEPLFERMAQPIRHVLSDGQKSAREVDAVVLVGGSCKMPVVQKYLNYLLQRTDIAVVSPDYMIALGAGVYAGIKERDEDIKDMLLTDICPFSLGVSQYNKADPNRDLCDVMIERNMALPVSREIVMTTVHDRQTRMRFEIYQGEAMYAEDNLPLGSITIPVPAGPEGKEKVRVRYTYDINGILVVDVQVISTGREKQLVIRNDKIKLSEEELKKRLEQLNKLKIHPRDLEENRLVLARAERLHRETTGRIRELLEERVQYFNDYLGRQDRLSINKARKQLNLFLDYVEERCLQGTTLGRTADGFPEWYESSRQAANAGEQEDYRKEEQKYERWRGGHLTS